MKQQFGVRLLELGKFRSGKSAIRGTQHFGAFLLLLRSVETNPDAIHLRAGVPKGNVLLEVVRTLQHGPGNYPMNVHFAPGDVLKNTIVGRRSPADVMMFGKPVDRDRHADAAAASMRWEWAGRRW